MSAEPASSPIEGSRNRIAQFANPARLPRDERRERPRVCGRSAARVVGSRNGRRYGATSPSGSLIVARSPNPQTIVMRQGDKRDAGGFQLHYRPKRCNAALLADFSIALSVSGKFIIAFGDLHHEPTRVFACQVYRHGSRVCGSAAPVLDLVAFVFPHS